MKKKVKYKNFTTIELHNQKYVTIYIHTYIYIYIYIYIYVYIYIET